MFINKKKKQILLLSCIMVMEYVNICCSGKKWRLKKHDTIYINMIISCKRTPEFNKFSDKVSCILKEQHEMHFTFDVKYEENFITKMHVISNNVFL